MSTCVKYDAALIDGGDYREGHVRDRRRGLTKSELRNLEAPSDGLRWIVVGWVNPLAPTDWKDE